MYHVRLALFHTVSAAVSAAELDSRTASSELLDSTNSTELLDSAGFVATTELDSVTIVEELLGSTGSLDVLEIPPQALSKATVATHKIPSRLFVELPLKLSVTQ
jgi:hypothetical protein